MGSIYPSIQIIRAAEDRYTTFHIYTVPPSDRRMSGARAIVLLRFHHVARPRVQEAHLCRRGFLWCLCGDLPCSR